MSQTTQREAALRYADAGWAIFPCRLDKRPITAHGFHDASTDAAQIREWWKAFPSASIGYRTGALVVAEIDGPDGMASRRAHEAQGLDWPVTLTSLSGRKDGGAHFFYRPPEGEVVRGSRQDGVGRSLGLGISVRASGQYVVLPPSPHPSGRRYLWLVTQEPAPLPGWMMARLKDRPIETRPRVPVGDATRYATVAFDNEVEAVERAPDGALNDTLNKAAYSLGRLVASGALREGEVRDALLAAAMQAGHPERGARNTINSGLVAGMRKAGR